MTTKNQFSFLLLPILILLRVARSVKVCSHCPDHQHYLQRRYSVVSMAFYRHDATSRSKAKSHWGIEVNKGVIEEFQLTKE